MHVFDSIYTDFMQRISEETTSRAMKGLADATTAQAANIQAINEQHVAATQQFQAANTEIANTIAQNQRQTQEQFTILNNQMTALMQRLDSIANMAAAATTPPPPAGTN